MKQILLILAAVILVGCGTTSWVSDRTDPNNMNIQASIRARINKPTGELTKADLEKVTRLAPIPVGWAGQLDVNKQLTEIPKELEKLTQLNHLYLGAHKMTDVTGLENLTQLKWLFLSANELTELPKGIENLTQVKWLWLNLNKLTDVTGLEKLTQLRQLDLKNNPDLTKAQIDALQKALPNCKIRSNPTK